MNIVFPLLIIFIIVIGMGVLRRASHRRTNLNSSKVKWIVGGYIVILIISMVVSSLIPAEPSTNAKIDSLEKIEEASQDFYDAVVEGRIDDLDRNYIDKEWQLDYHEQQLNLVVEGNEYLDLWIVVERKEINDAQLDIVSYRSRSTFGQDDFFIDFTDKLKPIGLYLSEDTLTLIKPERVELEFAKFKKEFTITQFTGEDWLQDYSTRFGAQRVLYLRIPKDLELIDAADLGIQFVEK